ncbi:selenocysteine-specific translation elongation factor [Ottowia oryzae]|uniref:Selenocysteine-specific elongation factor n=1 Tax=Ottowia oryzae TaxID=2109914 RepID=A0A2S0MGP4_9BURK|nr:selenocysteine-specific translation elongation factor [Ottowia oryzae]AVO35065.1 selenocysteine-specific translation elongation factor [Ottowia oryzae]
MIIGTAGHIDHGKSTLVRALTGVDTDRLPEEKKRGISIELGYAFLDVEGSDARVGFIDVPGHERLVHTMVAGASGIDMALLLVAADDGPMPQTLEHLAVLSLLGIRRGVVAITKADRASPERIAEVRAEMAALLAPTPLSGAPILAVSAQTGEGVDALKAIILEAARADAAGAEGGFDHKAFRLAIDRSFTLAGTGTVVTGTIHAGQVRVGDELAVLPTPSGQPVLTRARSLHAQNRAVEAAQAGQRCAVALPGIAKNDVERGQWLCDPAIALQTHRIDVQLTLWHGEAKAMKSGARVLVHIGAAHVAASVALLDVDVLAPGESALAQLVLHAPVGAWHGERVLLRDAAASRTVAGGTVLDPFAPTRYRRTPQRLAELRALTLPTAPERLAGLLAVAPYGVDVARFAAAQGLASLTPDSVPNKALAQAGLALGATQTEAFEQAALAALAAFHDKQPDELGPDTARLRRLAAPRLPAPLWQTLLARLAADGRLGLRGAVAHLPSHGAQLTAQETRIAQKVAPGLAAAGFEGAWVRDLAKGAGESEALVRITLARLARQGDLHQTVKDLYYAPATMARLAAIAREVGSEHDGDVLAAQFRDATGLGRKRAIQILEYFDRIGLTRRVGDLHKLRAESTLFIE